MKGEIKVYKLATSIIIKMSTRAVQKPKSKRETSSSAGPVSLENTSKYKEKTVSKSLVEEFQYQEKTVSDFESFFTLGKKVIIQGLENKPELNYSEVTVVHDVNGDHVIDCNGIIRVVVKTSNGDIISIKPANLFYDTAHDSPAQGKDQFDYDCADGSRIINCLSQTVGMHKSINCNQIRGIFFSDYPEYIKIFRNEGISLPPNG